MLMYDAEVHTPEALASEIGHIHADFGSARLGGSLGRAIIYGLVLGNPNFEYEQRHQSPLHTGLKARDIDVVGTNPIDTDSYEPFSIDTTSFVSSFLSLEKQDGDWFLTAARHGFAEPLHEDVVRPVYGETVLGIPSATLPAPTLLALYGTKGQMRPKDNLTKQLFNAVCENLPPEEQVSDELYKPFRDLTRLNQASLYLRAQTMYRQKVPLSIRTKLLPFAYRVKNL